MQSPSLTQLPNRDAARDALKAEKSKKPERIAAVVPLSWDYMSSSTVDALERLWLHAAASDAYEVETFKINADTIGKMRCLGVERVRATGDHFDRILFVDADMTWGGVYEELMPSDPLGRLLKYDLPVIGGLCRGRREPFAPTLWQRSPDGELFRAEPIGEGPMQVVATGGAFLLVKMEVFDRLDELSPGHPYFVNRRELVLPNDGEPQGVEDTSEDIYFCHRLEAAGIPLYVDCGCRIGHVTMAVICDSKDHGAVALFPKGA